jgi:hypothetical protein
MFEIFLGYICNPQRDDLILGAIGGSEAGEKLMSALSFKISSLKEYRLDKNNFFEVNYRDIPKKFRYTYQN